MPTIESTLMLNAQDYREFFNTMLGRGAIHHDAPLSPADIQILLNSPHGTMIQALLKVLGAHAEMLRQYTLLTTQKVYTYPEINMQFSSESPPSTTDKKANTFPADSADSAANTATKEENTRPVKTQHDAMARELNDLYGQLDKSTLQLTKIRQQRINTQKQYQVLLNEGLVFCVPFYFLLLDDFF